LEGLLGGTTLKDQCYHNEQLDIEAKNNITPLPLYLFIFITSELFLIYVTYDAVYFKYKIHDTLIFIYYIFKYS